MTYRKLAEEWLAQDPDPETRAELTAMLDDPAALAERFGAKLEFGTAGLRGELGAGPNRMNRVTVRRAAAGLAAVLGPGGKVVIGYDARHNSEIFARDTAEVLTGAGLRASLLPRPLPTPVLAFAVRELAADAGVMVTASHNPPRDNGYKVYWNDGSQIVPPVDAEISTAIDAVGRVDELPRDNGYETVGDSLLDAYLQAVTALPLGDARQLKVAYTPLHGVGADVLERALTGVGFDAPATVAAQREPDPDFPTVAFPNPEEPGAMDLAFDLAGEIGADLVLANDPDADRCAAGVPLGDGSFRMLTGDEVGGLLAEHVLGASSGSGERLVASTIVSSSLLGKIAAAYGVRHTETLTGFKWLMKAGDGLIYAYEEALGYSVGSDRGLPVHDKDGISAALTMASIAAAAKRDGRTLLDLLDDQARRFGLHATAQLAFRVADLSLITAAMARLRAQPPTTLGGLTVEAADDLSLGVAGLPPTDGLRYRLSGDARVVVRPSGTEPKLKSYLEVVVRDEPAAARDQAATQLTALKKDLTEILDLQGV